MKEGKKIKSTEIKSKEIKVFLFAKDMIYCLHSKIPEDLEKKILELANSNNVIGHKRNIQKYNCVHIYSCEHQN